MQIKYSFDAVTLKKIAKGALIATGGAAALGLLNYIGGLQINNPLLAMVVSAGVPFLINVVKEFMAGE